MGGVISPISSNYTTRSSKISPDLPLQSSFPDNSTLPFLSEVGTNLKKLKLSTSLNCHKQKRYLSSQSTQTPSFPSIQPSHQPLNNQNQHSHPSSLLNLLSTKKSSPHKIYPITEFNKSSSAATTTALSDFTQESNFIRSKILLDIPLQFLCKTILILYGPPLSDCDEISQYIANKFQFIILPIDNFLPFHEKKEEFLLRISQNDCQNGFILTNFPQMVFDVELLNLITIEYKKVVLVLDYDYTKLVRSKCSDWIHPPSGRKYHLKYNPPKSMKGTYDEVYDMFDDETGELLHQVVPRHDYLIQLKLYTKSLTLIRPYYSPVLSIIRVDQSSSSLIDELKSQILLTLCGIIANQPKLPGRLRTTLLATQIDEI